MDARHEGEQSGVAAQVITKLIKGAQAFFCLCHKVGIGLEMAETYGIVDMLDGDVVLMKNFS